MSRLMLLTCLLACGTVHAQESAPKTRHVSVIGTAITRVQPDTVAWQITVRRNNRDLAKAQAESAATVEKILALRSQYKLSPEDVQNGYLSIEKVYDRDQFGNQTSFKHYQVVRSIIIWQKDISRFDEVLAHLVGTADVEVSYQLESSKYHKVRSETRLDAVRAAREKATAMTELLEAKVGRVLRISESRESFGEQHWAGNSVSVAPRQAQPDEAPGTSAPGAIEIRVSIDVDFEIE